MAPPSVTLVVVVVGICCLWAVEACVTTADACPGCLSRLTDSGIVYVAHKQSSCDSTEDSVFSVCNIFYCNCEKCDPACSACQKAFVGFGGALAPAANTSTPADPCSSFDAFAALTVPQQMQQLNAAFCADASSSVGFKFLGYVLNLVDTNKDGVITCAEYNADQVSNLDIIKKKPDCRLKAGTKLKHAHSKV